MSYRLCERVSFCVTGGQAVFLDARRDRYFCVDGAAALAFQALVEQKPAPPEGLGKLIKAGLLEAGEGGANLQAPAIMHATRSLIEASPAEATVGAGTLLETALAVYRARWRLQRRPFVSILDELAARGPRRDGSATRPLGALTRAAASHNAARRRVPVKPVCLLDSLALLDCLARKGLFADLVFGVKLHPFGAHCWVQAEDMALNDSIDHVSVHTPILVVG